MVAVWFCPRSVVEFHLEMFVVQLTMEMERYVRVERMRLL